MLTKEQNEVLTRTAPGTPMGELLRRYWLPVAGVTELDKAPIKPLRIMHEDLVLYKDLTGNYGLVSRACAHRNSDLSYGFVEKDGIRCSYHGWCYDAKGRCIERPFEDIAFDKPLPKDRIRLGAAYPVRELAGLLWTYMGPEPAPVLPEWDPFTWDNMFREIVVTEIPCNWFQCQENAADPTHFEWTHENWSMRQRGKLGPYGPRHLKLDFCEFEFGIIYKRIREGMNEQTQDWSLGRIALWPNAFYPCPHIEWRIPIDDESTLNILWQNTRVPIDRGTYVQKSIPTWYGGIFDKNGRFFTRNIVNQDIVNWAGQGKITDRTKETLGSIDRGVTMMRERFFRDLAAIASGKDPSGLIRDPARGKNVPLPVAGRDFFHDGVTLDEWRKHPLYSLLLSSDDFVTCAGRPPEVVEAFNEAIGIA